MNLLLLLLGLRPWRARSSLELLTSVCIAVSVLSLEMQLATWAGLGTLRSLAWVNLVVVLLALVVRPRLDTIRTSNPVLPDRALPWAGVLVLVLVVLAVNLGMPLTAADDYHLERADRIARLGTLAYDPSADPKLNMLSSLYEMVLADVGTIPVIGAGLVRLHGIAGLLLYLVAIGSTRELLGSRPGWPWLVLLAIPVVFHQLVLVKNDLLVGALGLVVLAWTMTRARDATWREMLWAAWLAGLSVTVKLTSLPVALVLTGVVLLQRTRDRARALGALALGGLIGIVSGGFFFTVVENARLYGTIMPSEDVGPRYAGALDVVVGVARYTLSLFDLGLLTPELWPGRGGWGGTFGLPLIWALVVLLLSAARVPIARTALACIGVYFLVFALALPDADLSQRLALAPGLLLIAIACAITVDDGGLRSRFGQALIPVLALSGLQIARSAVLYLVRS